VPKPSKRDQLIEATKELLWEVGYEAMSPRDIQTRSAARPGSLYHHFPSKLAIAAVALGEAAVEEITYLEEVFSGNSAPLEVVRQYLLLQRETLRGCRLGRLVHEVSLEREELRQPVAAYFDAVRTHVSRSLAQAQAEGTLEARFDTENIAISLVSLIQGGYVLARAFQDKTLMRRAIDGALSLLSEVSSSTRS
jgi:AcrR family transcriptional regulator